MGVVRLCTFCIVMQITSYEHMNYLISILEAKFVKKKCALYTGKYGIFTYSLYLFLNCYGN